MQTDGSSCGLFALSFAHTLCEGKDPSRVAYFVGTPSVLIVSLVFKTRHVHVLRVIEMSDYMQFSATIYMQTEIIIQVYIPYSLGYTSQKYILFKNYMVPL